MKVEHAERHVLGSSGLSESAAFKIRTNAHAFRLLSSGLYSDKVAAVLREIGCNAADAHIEAGIAHQPFEVKLPNRIDNQFYIKDWGPGLSHAAVMELYTTYFASTKQDSNDYTGAFGLGSKSPFSYTDAFTITSSHGGRVRTYTAHLDDTGSPTIAKLAEDDAPADWPHGVLVGFPVKPGDYVQFQERAASIFQWFKVVPRVLGAPQIVPAELSYDSPTFAKLGNGTIRFSSVLMGNVTYPLNHNKFASALAGGTGRLASHVFLFGQIYIKLPIGAVQVAASREELQYDRASAQTLKLACETVVREIAANMAKHLDKFAAADWVGKSEMVKTRDIWGQNSGYLNWTDIFSDAGFAKAAEYAHMISANSVKLPNYTGSKSSFRVLEPGPKRVHHTLVVDGRTTHKYPSDVTLDLEPTTAIYYGTAPHPLARARLAVQTGPCKQLVLVVPHHQRDPQKVSHAEEAKRLARELKIAAIHDIASLPLPAGFAAKGTGKRQGKKKGTVLMPIPAIKVEIVTGDKPAPADLSLVTKDSQSFMCKMPSYGWYYHDRGIRVFEKTAEVDKCYAVRIWNTHWLSFTALQKELGTVTATGYVLLTAEQIRTAALVKRGWPTTYDMMKAWLTDPKTRDLVGVRAAKWRPTVDMSRSHNWVEFLVRTRNSDPAIWAAFEPALAAAGVAAEVNAIRDASVAAGDMAGENTPKVVALYNALAVEFALLPINKAGSRSYLSPEDLNTQLINRFPVLSVIDNGDVRNVAKMAPAKLSDFAKYLFS